MIENQNFMATAIEDIPVDTEYRWCNFSRRNCLDVASIKKGHRLFPGDDTPLTFRHCNLVNCEVPPASVIDGCNGLIVDNDIVLSADVITIDGEDITVETRGNRAYGVRNDDGSYTYFPSPRDTEVEL